MLPGLVAVIVEEALMPRKKLSAFGSELCSLLWETRTVSFLWVFFACAVSLLLSSVSAHNLQTLSKVFHTSTERRRAGFSLVREQAAEHNFSRRGSEETNTWGINGMGSLVRVGEVYVAQTAQ